ncbi:MAG: SDR family NAD(P)-dependent oxidoreductase [Oscillospiraceae bacterium]|nr:SDR family NAD(P)-dependent oxidoreductase [Oscillospiraceae bacterium]
MKIAVITGASSGMGREFVLAIDRDYALDELWVIARREDRLAQLRSECRTAVRVLPWDLTDPENLVLFKKLLETEQPQIHLLVNAAGYGLFGTFGEMELENQLGIIDLNDKALTAMCLLSLPYMQQGDSIVNLGSNSSWQPVPYLTVYAASKAYVLSFSRALGRELKSSGIHVMCVCPGWIRTEFMDRAVHDDTISYYDRWYTARQVIDQAMKDLKKKKKVSILGAPVRRQVRLVKHLPVDLVMNTWCKQQKKD